MSERTLKQDLKTLLDMIPEEIKGDESSYPADRLYDFIEKFAGAPRGLPVPDHEATVQADGSSCCYERVVTVRWRVTNEYQSDWHLSELAGVWPVAFGAVDPGSELSSVLNDAAVDYASDVDSHDMVVADVDITTELAPLRTARAASLLDRLLDDKRQQLHSTIREQDILAAGKGGFWSTHKGSGSNPVPCTAEELAERRARAANAAAEARLDLAALGYLAEQKRR